MKKMFLFGLLIKSCFVNWGLFSKGFIILSLIWLGYFMVINLTSDMNVDGLVKAYFWLAIISSGIIFFIASLRSMLPALLAWLLIIPMYFFGGDYAMNLTLIVASTALIINVVSYRN